MKGWPMYQQIQQLKEMGLNKSQVEKKLGINWKTVDRYWDMPADGFAGARQKNRHRGCYLEQYESEILEILQEDEGLSASAVDDRLREKHPGYAGSERTLRRFLAPFRDRHGLAKPAPARQYQAVPEMAPGAQAQVDLGQAKARNREGKWITLYGLALVLSHSRFKYVEWSERPFSAARFVQAHYRALLYVGGVSREIVYDQEKLAVVSENHGETIFTAEFQAFRQTMGFGTYVCRAEDPESKGKIEAVIKYAKGNFVKGRRFTDLKSFNASCLEWLERTANAKVHGTTKKVPAQVLPTERAHLRPVPQLEFEPGASITRGVRKDNTILYQSNRYALPLGTYREGREVAITEKDQKLVVADLETGERLAVHQLARGKGKLVSTTSQQRDRSQGIPELYQQVLELLGATPEAEEFLQKVKEARPRYVRDQYQLVAKVAREHPTAVAPALEHCVGRELWSAVSFAEVAECQAANQDVSGKQKADALPASAPASWFVKAEVRDIAAYAGLYGGGDQ